MLWVLGPLAVQFLTPPHFQFPFLYAVSPPPPPFSVLFKYLPPPTQLLHRQSFEFQLPAELPFLC